MAHVLGEPLASPPEDGVTRVRFSPAAGDATLLAASWDGTARLYNAAEGTALGAAHLSAPLLDCAFGGDATAFFTAGLDGRVCAVDAVTLQVIGALGSHGDGNGGASSAAKAVEWLEPCGLLASAGWDARICLWDPRCAPPAARVAAARLPGKAFALGGGGGRLVAAAADRRVCVYDAARPPAEMLETGELRESSLKYQTRCAAAHGGGYALGSVEGRVAMEVFDPSPAAQRRKYAFKCHRRAEGGVDTAYPVHSIAFHPVHGTFATGGGDGAVCLWDGAQKKRLLQISQYPTGISSVAFSADGTMLAAAASYCWERGPAGDGGSSSNNGSSNDDTAAAADGGGACGGGGLFVRRMADAEVRPKQRSSGAA